MDQRVSNAALKESKKFHPGKLKTTRVTGGGKAEL